MSEIVLLVLVGVVLLGLVGLAVLVLRQGTSLRGAAQAGVNAQASAHMLQAHVDSMARAQAESGRLQAELAARLQTVSETVTQRQDELARGLQERMDGLTQRLGQNIEAQTKAQGENLTRLSERLAVIDRAQANITELSAQVVSLQDILSNKQARGAFGQGRMEQIIADGLPSNLYTFQHTLSNGRRPDCAIRLPNQDAVMIVDAKFPLEGYNALRDAETAEELKGALARVRRDVGVHISEIAERYFIPGETQDTAILFVPSEALYAELHERFEDVIQKAYRARVVIVSPTLLMLSVQVMQAALRDVKMREQTHLVQREIGMVMQDVTRLADRVAKLDTHFEQSRKDIDQIKISADKIVRRSDKIVSLPIDDGPFDAEGGVRLPSLN